MRPAARALSGFKPLNELLFKSMCEQRATMHSCMHACELALESRLHMEHVCTLAGVVTTPG
eukprot:12050609-Ditylum_brightwellii.AAC.1